MKLENKIKMLKGTSTTRLSSADNNLGKGDFDCQTNGAFVTKPKETARCFTASGSQNGENTRLPLEDYQNQSTQDPQKMSFKTEESPQEKGQDVQSKLDEKA